ncbi:MAG: alanyl-tRNA editing protein [Burkholderiales bacterium]|nr:alanyl-tRNA editing protein [Burkholderiales bacterium]
MLTRELFRDDAYLRAAPATVLSADAGGVVLDATVFYATGGGQPGDTGTVAWDGGSARVTDTRRDGAGRIVHLIAPGDALPAAGTPVRLAIDWERRHRLMRMHTCLHVLTAVVPGPVNGGAVREDSGRLDFDLQGERLDRAEIDARLNALIRAGAAVRTEWVTDDELRERPELVRTMSVKPPSGFGRVRLLRIDGIDLQACGGTHVADIAEIGPVTVTRIESKGRQNRRVSVAFA